MSTGLAIVIVGILTNVTIFSLGVATLGLWTKDRQETRQEMRNMFPGEIHNDNA